MKLSADYWIKYINTHTSANKAAERRMERYIAVHGTDDMDKLADYAYALVSKYGEAASALSCEMYDKTARAQHVNVPEAVPAETASYGEVASAVRGAGKRSPSLISDAVGRLVKQAGADTTLQNAKRDGAYFAWVAHGDTCPYCMALAGLGWQKAGALTLKGGHAEHIHANCDCEYAVDHNGNLEIEGYDPREINQQLLDMTDGEYDAENLIRMSGRNGKGRDHGALNIVRRKHYAANRDYINAQKRAAYARLNKRASTNKWGHKVLSIDSIEYDYRDVSYSKNYDYSIKIAGLSDAANTGLSEAAERVAKMGSENRKEYMFLVNLDTGRLEHYEEGSYGEVGRRFRKYATANRDSRYAFVHNHNNISSLSQSDLEIPIRSENIPIVIAVRNDSVKYIAERIKAGTPGFDASTEYEDILKPVNRKVRNGEIDGATWTLEKETTIIKALIDDYYGGEIIRHDGRK